MKPAHPFALAVLLSLACRHDLEGQASMAERNLAWSHFQMAELELRQGRLEESLEAVRGARRAFEALNEVRGQGLTLGFEGRVLLQQRKLDEALEILRAARVLLEQVGDTSTQALTWIDEGQIHALKGDPDAALAAYRQGRQLSAAIGDPVRQGASWGWESRLLLSQNRLDEALVAIRTARGFAEQTGDLASQATTWIDEADILTRQEKWQEALAASERGRPLAEAVRDPVNQARAWRIEGRSRLRQGELEAALRAYRNSRDLFQTLSDSTNLRIVWMETASVLRDLADFSAALEAYRQAGILAANAGDDTTRARALLGQGFIHYLLENQTASAEAYQEALDVLMAIDAVDEPVHLEIHANASFGLARTLRGQRKLHSAQAAYRQARGVYELLKDREGVGLALLGEADTSIILASEETIHLYRRARKIFEESENVVRQGDSWKGEAITLDYLGKIAPALYAYRQARTLYEQAEYLYGQGACLEGEASLLARSPETYLAALAAFRHARRVFESLEDADRQGDILAEEGLILAQLGKWDDSEKSFTKARELSRDPSTRASIWVSQAITFYIKGYLEEYIEAVRQARQEFQKAEDKRGQAFTWLGEAGVLDYLGGDARALDAAREALEIYRELQDHDGQMECWLLEASIHVDLEDRKSARRAFESARDLLESSQTQRTSMSFVQRLAKLREIFEGRSAVETYREYREIAAQRGTPMLEGLMWLWEAGFLHSRGDREASRQAVLTAERLLSEDVFLELFQGPTSLIQAATANPSEEPEEVERLASQAMDLHSNWRTAFIDYKQRAAFDEAIQVAYDLLIPIHSRVGNDIARALTLTELTHSRAFLDALSVGGMERGYVPERLIDSRDALRARLARIGKQLEVSGSKSSRERLLAERGRLEASLEWNLYEQLATEARSGPSSGQALDAKEIQLLSRDVGPILVFYSAEDELVEFLISPDSTSIRTHHVAWPREQVSETVQAWIHGLANPLHHESSTRWNAEIWHGLFAHLVEHLPESGPLTIIPHGALHGLAFEALINPATQRPIFERWDISVAPSVSVLQIARRRHELARTHDSFLALSAGRDLNRPELEVFDIAELFTGPRTILGPGEAHFATYQDLAAHSRQLLIASRGVQQERQRLNGTYKIYSYLEIEPSEDVHDHRLTAGEIATIPIEAELVTLAACDTARGRTFPSDDRLNLTRSFLLAGAAAVLATRWRIPEDVATSRFLGDFYRAYRHGGASGHGLRKDEALTLARRAAFERGDSAQVWAAWVLVGDAR